MGNYNPAVHHRRSIRLKEYDYSRNGAYFVTICVQDRLEMFGTIDDGVMQMSRNGEIAQQVWESLPERFPGTDVDYFVVMPNHFHGILVRTEEIPRDAFKSKEQRVPSSLQGTLQTYRTTLHRPALFNEMVRTFKAATCRLIRKEGCTEFAWQSNYYEHIIRNDEQLHTIRNYILNNPQTWHKDTLKP